MSERACTCRFDFRLDYVCGMHVSEHDGWVMAVASILAWHGMGKHGLHLHTALEVGLCNGYHLCLFQHHRLP